MKIFIKAPGKSDLVCLGFIRIFKSHFHFITCVPALKFFVLVYFLFSFQLLICNAIKIPITTSTISPMAYLKYFEVLPSLRRF